MTLPVWWRKFFLTIHVTTSVGMVGAVACFVTLAIIGATTTIPVLIASTYLAMHVLTWWVIVPLGVATLLFGILQSLGTPWGLFRYYWIVFKLALTVLALLVLLLQTPTIGALSEAAMAGNLPTLNGGRAGVILHSAGGLLVLLLATVLSVYKPRGVTRYGASRI
jgi:hypothetical protein